MSFYLENSQNFSSSCSVFFLGGGGVWGGECSGGAIFPFKCESLSFGLVMTYGCGTREVILGF